MEPARKELLAYLEHGGAHAPLLKVAEGVPEDFMNRLFNGIPFTPWALLEHIRLTQNDMVDFIKNPSYKEKGWPMDYWPAKDAKATKAIWDKTLMGYTEDLEALREIVKDARRDLFAPIAHGDGQTIEKEILQVIDHAAYHTGELVLMRRLAGAWK